MWQISFDWILELDVELAWSKYLYSDGSNDIKTKQTNFHLDGGRCEGEMGSGFQLGQLPDSFKLKAQK
jgi:hypothetical protein